MTSPPPPPENKNQFRSTPRKWQRDKKDVIPIFIRLKTRFRTKLRNVERRTIWFSKPFQRALRSKGLRRGRKEKLTVFSRRDTIVLRACRFPSGVAKIIRRRTDRRVISLLRHFAPPDALRRPDHITDRSSFTSGADREGEKKGTLVLPRNLSLR